MGRIGLEIGIYPIATKEEMLQFGKLIAKQLPIPSTLALTGNLGSGKTTFVQGLAEGLGIQEPIQSPTFVLCNLYDQLAHFDLYRLKNEQDFIALGFDEYLDTDRIAAIEWPEKILPILPKNTIHLHFSYDDETRIVERVS